MDTSKDAQDKRRVQLQRQVEDLESAIQSLRLKKDDREARNEYFRLKGVWARKKALLDSASRSSG